MAISASLRNESRKPGMAGFYGRAAITDDLITQSLENKLANERYKTDVAAKTDLTNTAATLATREKEAALGSATTLKQEGMQQEGMTARQRITEAGNMAVQKLSGSQALDRVAAVGKETRKTKKTRSAADQDLYDEITKGMPSGAQAGGRQPYVFKPGGGLSIEEPSDIEELLNTEEW